MSGIIGRRRFMQAAALPYDAEVLWLQSSGTQYIDTGLKPGDIGERFSYRFEVKWTITGDRQLMGAQNINFCGIDGSGMYESYLTTSYTGSTTTFDIIEFLMAHVNWTYRRFTYINAPVTLETWSSSSQYSTNNICIFGIYTTDGTALQFPCSCQLKSFKIYNDQTSEVFFDAIPVRVGSVGYMYDRVSGQLFGNDGTGDFTVGPDV